jgi:hypothetical protein
MAAKAILDIYHQHVRPLPTEQQLELLALIANGLAAHAAPTSKRRPLSIPELHGAARASADGSDAQEFVTKLRKEWDQRSW